MNNETFGFTKDKIARLPILEKTYYVYDSNTPYLRIAVYPSGVKTYLVCRKVKGQWQRIKIGRMIDVTIEQARKECLRINSLVALGQDPQGDKTKMRQGATFRQLYDYYYEHHAKHFTKRPEDNRRTMEVNVFPVFGNMKALEITPEKLRRFHFALSEKTSKGNANRVLAIISPVFNFCIRNEKFNGLNPCRSVKRFKEVSRDRFLSQDELLKFFQAIEEEDDLFKDYFSILLYTGARKSNVLAMKWKDVDLTLRRWRISETEAKNGDVNIVLLCETAVSILQRRHENNRALLDPSLYVFASTGEEGYLNDPKRAFARVVKKMGSSNFRMHDLRRTLGSYMAIEGASLPVIGKALNHKSQVSTAIYARLSQEPVFNAINSAVRRIQDKGSLTIFRQNKELFFHEMRTYQFADLVA